MLLFSGGVQLFEKSPALAGAGVGGGTYGGATAVLGGNAGAAAGNPAAAVNPAAAAGQMALYNQLAGGLAAMETLLGHLNKEEAARQQKVLEQARERARELAEEEEKYISANIQNRAEALAAVEGMMRELGLTQSQYEAIRDALIAQNVISAAAGQAYAGAWEDLLCGDLAEYGVGYAPVLGNIYFIEQSEKSQNQEVEGTNTTTGSAMQPQKDPKDEEDGAAEERENIRIEGNRSIFINKSGKEIVWADQGPKDIDTIIKSKLSSAVPGDKLEGKVAMAAKEITEIKGVGLKLLDTSKSPIGDLDVVTDSYIIEVKASLGAVKEKQIPKYTNPSHPSYVNAGDKKVIYFIEDAIPKVPKEVEKLQMIKNSGAIVVDNIDDLKEILKNGK